MTTEPRFPDPTLLFGEGFWWWVAAALAVVFVGAVLWAVQDVVRGRRDLRPEARTAWRWTPGEQFDVAVVRVDQWSSALSARVKSRWRPKRGQAVRFRWESGEEGRVVVTVEGPRRAEQVIRGSYSGVTVEKVRGEREGEA